MGGTHGNGAVLEFSLALSKSKRQFIKYHFPRPDRGRSRKNVVKSSLTCLNFLTSAGEKFLEGIRFHVTQCIQKDDEITEKWQFHIQNFNDFNNFLSKTEKVTICALKLDLFSSCSSKLILPHAKMPVFL